MSKIKIKYSGDLRTESIQLDSESIIVTDATKVNQRIERNTSEEIATKNLNCRKKIEKNFLNL